LKKVEKEKASEKSLNLDYQSFVKAIVPDYENLSKNK